MADGDFNFKLDIDSKDEIGELANSFKILQKSMQTLITEMDLMSKEHDAGDIDVKIDENKFKNDFQLMAKGVNSMVFGHIAVNKQAMACVKEFGEGNCDAPLAKFPGKKAFINDTIEQVRANIKALIADANLLAKAAVEGKLATRADASKHKGDFHRIVKGVNDTLDAVVGPLDVTAKYVDDISKGIIPPIITDTYNGDFNIIKNNLNNMVKMMNDLLAQTDILIKGAADGELDKRANADMFVGGWNQLVVGVNEVMVSISGPVQELREVLGAMENGDLTLSMVKNYKGTWDELKSAVNNMLSKLSQVVTDVNSSAQALAGASEQVSATAQSLSQGSSEQAASVEETSASVEQMSASIKQNTESAKVTDGMASKAAKEASEGGVAVSKTVKAMKSIADKIGIIDDIAYQTNLLALNAAIEAARAGEHGKGFAVVAAEVRKLAERSQIAAQEIGEVAKSSVGLAEQAGKLLNEMVPSIQKTSDLVQEISAASEEQSSGAAQINSAMEQLNSITQQSASSSEELAATAEEMSGQAEQLQQMMQFFKVAAEGRARQPQLAATGTQTKAQTRPTNFKKGNGKSSSEFVKF